MLRAIPILLLAAACAGSVEPRTTTAPDGTTMTTPGEASFLMCFVWCIHRVGPPVVNVNIPKPDPPVVMSAPVPPPRKR